MKKWNRHVNNLCSHLSPPLIQKNMLVERSRNLKKKVLPETDVRFDRSWGHPRLGGSRGPRRWTGDQQRRKPSVTRPSASADARPFTSCQAQIGVGRKPLAHAFLVRASNNNPSLCPPHPGAAWGSPGWTSSQRYRAGEHLEPAMQASTNWNPFSPEPSGAILAFNPLQRLGVIKCYRKKTNRSVASMWRDVNSFFR